MNRRIAYLIRKGGRSLGAARKHLSVGDFDFAVSRAYYAMFHVTQAILLTKNLTASKHSGLLSLFSEQFVKPGLVERSLHQDLHRAFELRQKGDYWSEDIVTKETASELCEKAERFISTLELLMKK